MAKKPEFQLADILREHRDQLAELASNSWKARTLFAIMRCRTAGMGGHIDRCTHPDCQKLHISYNSCRNRHCPRCQGHLRERWIQAREQDLLNTRYFHVVFTLPDHLNELVLQKPAVLYGLLFRTAWGVIRDFAGNSKFLGAQTGMIAVLHSWGQNLSVHPHLHCLVPAGGINESGKWKASRSKGKFLFPVRPMSQVFRARFTEALRKQIKLPTGLSEKLFSKPWVVYCKQPFYGPGQIIEYLGRYSHKIGISNHRIQGVQNGKVRFTVKDYRKGGKKSTCTLEAKEFIRRFALHILPKGFTRIRHYGILASSLKASYKSLADEQLGPPPIKQPEERKLLLNLCPACKKGALETIAVFDQRGPPAHWLPVLKSA